MKPTIRRIFTTVFAILILPHNEWHRRHPRHPTEIGMSELSTIFMVAEGAVTGGQLAKDDDVVADDIKPPGPAFKEWRLNTNFDNVHNWHGLRGHENCSRNIYSFPTWYDEQFVVTLPEMFRGKQIILPVNAHFVFKEGSHTFLNSAGDATGESETTCEGREVEYLQTIPSDWFDPDSWIHRGNLQGAVRDNDGRKRSTIQSSLLNLGKVDPSSRAYDPTATLFTAIPHAEQVPCQYDFAWFRGNSTFSLKISSDVTIAGFYLGDQKRSHSDMALLMNSTLGKLQFQKAPQTIFSITGNDDNVTASGKKSESPVCTVGNADSDRCICSNYLDRNIKQKICALANCVDENEDNCPNPITPHGFCCSVCGFHIKIRHSGSVKLSRIYTSVKAEISRADLPGKLKAHLARYKDKGAHLIILPQPQHSKDLTIRRKIQRLVAKLESMVRQEREVIEVTLTESWGRAAGDGGSSDRLEGSGLGGGLITLIVFLVLAVILAGIALFIFMWNRKHGYPPLTLSTVTSALPRMSSMRIPIVPGGGSGGRRSSTLSNSLHSFGFARFTNERMSSVTISPGESSSAEGGSESAGTGGSGKPSKSSSIRRADKVDDEPLPMMTEEQVNEKVTDANSGAFGFTNVTYDLVAGTEDESKVEEQQEASNKGKFPTLTIPEVKVVDMAEKSSTSEKMAATSTSTNISEQRRDTPSSAETEKGKSAGVKKSGKPGFVAARLGKAYQKLGGEEHDNDENTNSAKELRKKKGKKKGKTEEGNFKSTRLEEENDSEDDVAVTKKAESQVVPGTSLLSNEASSQEVPVLESGIIQSQNETDQDKVSSVVEGELVNLG